MIALVVASAYLALLGARAALAWRYARRCPVPGPADFGRVCVLQPILSGDPGLERALEDNVVGMPGVRFLWLVDDDDAVGIEVCEALRRRHPTARIEVLVCPTPPPGRNPKLWKLEHARAAVTEPVLVVLDDDTRLPGTSLAALLAAVETHELATGLPGSLHDARLPSRLLAQFVNDGAALTYLPLLNVCPPMTINGMTWAIRRDTLEGTGGFAPLLHHLTDDLAVARRILGAGGTIYQSPYPQWVQTTVSGLGHYGRIMHRWFLFALLLVRRQPIGTRLAIGTLFMLPPLLLWAMLLAVALEPGRATIVVVAGTLIVRAVTLAVTQRRIYGRVLHEPALSIASELLQPVHLAHAAVDRRIVWRTRRYRVLSDEDFVEIG